jgi:hypothetical protein
MITKSFSIIIQEKDSLLMMGVIIVFFPRVIKIKRGSIYIDGIVFSLLSTRDKRKWKFRRGNLHILSKTSALGVA